MKPLITAIATLLWVVGFSQKTFIVDSIGRREGHVLPLFEKKADSTNVFYIRIWGAGKPRIRKGMVGTMTTKRNRLYLSFKK